VTFYPAGDESRYAHRVGRFLRVTRGLYTDDLDTPLAEQVERGWSKIAALLVPGAVVTARCGPVGRPVDGVLYVAGGRDRPVVVPGLTIVTVPGPGAAAGDLPLEDRLWLASEARMLVDNARPSRSIGGRPAATLSRDELHDHIAHIVTTRTSRQTDNLLADVARYADFAHVPGQGESVALFIASARGERPTVTTRSTTMRAAQQGRGIDGMRLSAFRAVAGRLAQIPPQVLPAAGGQVAQPAFEAYFSNFIEGTEFTVDEALKIIVDGSLPAARPADAHDVLGTYRAVTDPTLGDAVPVDSDDLVELLRARHRLVMEGRPEVHPGQFKVVANRAGATESVAPPLVEGTLREGWQIGRMLVDPFARALYLMFLVSEVHPFADGNGRVARLTMNAELSAAHETRAVTPTILRSDYLSALVKTTVHGEPSGLVAVVGHARRHTAQIDYSTYETAVRMLRATNAFVDAREAERSGLALVLPATLDPGWRYSA
jgi:hypothetical protein